MVLSDYAIKVKVLPVSIRTKTSISDINTIDIKLAVFVVCFIKFWNKVSCDQK